MAALWPVDRPVKVGLDYRTSGADEWQPAPGYEAWEGVISALPAESKYNGYVNVMPSVPRGDEVYFSGHPIICDLSPRHINNSSEVQIRHTLTDLATSGLGEVALEGNF